MTVTSISFTLSTKAGTDVQDITDRVRDAVTSSGIRDGIACVFVPGSTAAITTIEFENGVIQDLVGAIERAAPKDIPYAHDAAWHDGNGHSHVRSALIGPSFTVPFANGRLMLGTWQQIVLLDFDNRDRKRKVIVQVVGE